MARRPKFHPLVDAPLSTLVRMALVPASVLGHERASRIATWLGRVQTTLDRTHYTRAMNNLRDAYPQWSAEQRERCAVACHQHLMQLAVEFALTPRMLTLDAVHRHMVFSDMSSALASMLRSKPTILITGHVGNWEMVGYAVSMLGFDMCAVYRPLDLRGADAWVKRSREGKGLRLISKFGAARAMPAVMQAGFPVGLVADQSGGDRGVFAPFFGRLTSTYKMIGLLAMRFGATVVCGLARRMAPGEPAPGAPWEQTHFAFGPAASGKGCAQPAGSVGYISAGDLRYSVELVDKFAPEDWEQQPDPLYYITARYRRAMELMIRRCPEQYFWMHRIWRSRPAHERLQKPFPHALRDKMRALPWLSESEVDALVDQSERDTRDLQRLQRA